MAFVAPGVLEGHRQQRCPRQAGNHQQRQVEPPWATVLGIVTGKTADMLVPEEEAPVVRLLGVYCQHPRQRDNGRHQHGHQAVLDQFQKALLPEHVGQSDQYRQQQSQKTLGHKAHAAGKTQYRPTDQAITIGAAVDGKPQRHQAQVDPQGKLRIKVGITGLACNQAKGHVHQGAGKALARIVPQATGHGIGQEHAQTGGDGRGNAHAKQVFAKNGLADGNHPVAGNRLLEVTQIHKVRGDPVTVDQDLLADLCVARFVRDPQAVGAQWQQVKGDKGQNQQRYCPA